MKTSIVWLRQDLRLCDNPALYHATRESARVIILYIHAPDEASPWAPGAASNWWRHQSLLALQNTLRQRGGELILRRGPSLAALRKVIKESGAEAIYWNQLYEPQLEQRDHRITAALQQEGLEIRTFNGALLYAPGTVLNKSGAPFRVFSAFWKTCQQRGLGEPPLPAPERFSRAGILSEPLETLGLMPRQPWHHNLAQHWQAGEAAALTQLQQFCAEALEDYPVARDIPARPGSSRLSPHLAAGEISPRQIVAALLDSFVSNTRHGAGTDCFMRELGWREFAYHTLSHFPRLTDQPFNPRFEHFPWRDDENLLAAWQQGKTGFPIVDAGMRQLWQTGWMHNRVRMIVASLLSKNGMIAWQHGARWFWDTLVDADLANNSFNWQWVAGCGLDAAPYFRIFNPVKQSEKFDPRGDYLRRWLPELAALPDRWLHRPWSTPLDIQADCGVQIGIDYPHPILDLDVSRRQALLISRQTTLAKVKKT